MGTHYNCLTEAVLTSIHYLCFEQTYEKYQFLIAKISVFGGEIFYVLNRCVSEVYTCILRIWRPDVPTDRFCCFMAHILFLDLEWSLLTKYFQWLFHQECQNCPLRGLNTFLRYSMIFNNLYKGDNFCDYCLPYHALSPFCKGSVVKGKNLFTGGADSFLL